MKASVDIAVAGGGASGIAAALVAAGQGLTTLLFDQRPSAGGTAGFSGLTTLCGCYDDRGELLLDGFAREFVERVSASRPLQMGRVWVLPYRPERFREVADSLIGQSENLRAEWNTSINGATLDDHKIQTLNGIAVKAVIDCSGTAEVARVLQLECLETTPATQAPAIVFPLCNVTRDLSTPAEMTQVLLPLARAGLPALTLQTTTEPGTLTVKFSGGANRIGETIDFLRSNVAGFEQCATPVSDFVPARRVGRMIPGEYVLTAADVLGAAKFPDAAARCAWPIEQWDTLGRVRLRYVPEHDFYEVPARSLRSASIRNLFMAGKTISADVDAIGSARVMGCCLATGAAGWQSGGPVGKIRTSDMTKDFEKLWAETFRYASERSPFYREHLKNHRSVPSLVEINPVDKAILSHRNLDFLCVEREEVIEVVTTSGTTGQPVLWMLTQADLERLGKNERLSFECAGLTARDTVLLAVGMDRCFVAGLAYWLGLRDLGCGVIRAGPSSPALVLELLERIQPTAIVAVPSFLRVIAEKAAETGFDLKSSSVKKAICIGEPVRDKAFVVNAAGTAIESAWGARVFSTYGVTEFANSLCECEAGQGGHLHEQQLYLEVLDDADKPVAGGEIGEITGTTFGVEGMPLIRYRTGDCATMFREPCPCGRTSPRIGPIIGRKHQKLKIRGTSLFPSTLQTVLEQAEGVETFVIVARSKDDLSDSIEILVHGGASLPALRDLLQARSKVAPQIRQASRGEIEALQMPSHSRKRRTFVDLR